MPGVIKPRVSVISSLSDPFFLSIGDGGVEETDEERHLLGLFMGQFREV